MRIRTVSVEGFGPFKQKQVVDFTVFDADGLFLIAGETGVGKTSILDAIAYALYNRTPRWDQVTGTGASAAVRSDFCGPEDATEVILEFETNGDKYRVTRSPEYERPKRYGEGMTQQGARVLVEVREGQQWVGKATRERDAAELIEDLVKLTRAEFLQVIMLAQGRFQEFLLADSTQRVDVLSKLFGTDDFADYQTRVTQRRTDLGRRLETSRTQQTVLLGSVEAPEGVDPPDAGAEVAWLDAIVGLADTAVTSARESVTAAEAAERAARERLEVARKQQRRDAAVQALTELGERTAEIEHTTVLIRRAEQSERVRPLLEAAAEQADAARHAQAAVNQAREDYLGAAEDADLGTEVDRLTRQIGALADELQEEERAVALTTELAAADQAASDLAEKVTTAAATIGRLQEERESLSALAATLSSVQAAVEHSRARLAAATEAAAVAETLRRAQETLLAADQRLTAARTDADQVLGRFLHGQAGILATHLVDGEPCSVCGSTAHPAPAALSDESASQEDVDAAHAVVAGLEAPAREARERVGELQVRAAQLQGAAGDADLETLTAALAVADTNLTAARAAVSQISDIDEALQGETGLIAAHAGLERERTEVAATVTRLGAEVTALTEKLARLRGDHPSVMARHAALVAECDTARFLASAIATLGDASTRLSTAEERLAAKLVGEGFDTAEDARAALRTEAEVEELRDRITTHAAAVSEHQGVLKQAELQNLPEEQISVGEAETAHRGALDAARTATRAVATVEESATRLVAQRAQLAGIVTATQSLAEEFQVLHRLAETVNGRSPNTKNMTLESYYIAAELEQVLVAANQRLAILSHSRFEFRHTERGVRRANAAAGLEIEVYDEYTGTARPANQLSGGEQFLGSLALALGLAEVVTSRAGGIELNTLFIDEGFGSLSAEYLEIAMETLDSLKEGGRTVGVISHVVSMQERIAAQLVVTADAGGPSTIHQDLSVPA